MPNMDAPLKLGVNLWNQYVDWPRFLEGMQQGREDPCTRGADRVAHRHRPAAHVVLGSVDAEDTPQRRAFTHFF